MKKRGLPIILFIIIGLGFAITEIDSQGNRVINRTGERIAMNAISGLWQAVAEISGNIQLKAEAAKMSSVIVFDRYFEKLATLTRISNILRDTGAEEELITSSLEEKQKEVDKLRAEWYIKAEASSRAANLVTSLKQKENVLRKNKELEN